MCAVHLGWERGAEEASLCDGMDEAAHLSVMGCWMYYEIIVLHM